ncbi:MAG: hypothetical protein NC489_46590 [Ruminococcus flavefaciens]|nr:hypothetical protein [Ruminococcus flavefaciens]
MTKKETIENNAYMILNELAFLFISDSTGNKVAVVNLKNINQSANFRVRGKDLLLCESSMSKENTYKAMLIVERNKQRLVGELNRWASM